MAGRLRFCCTAGLTYTIASKMGLVGAVRGCDDRVILKGVGQYLIKYWEIISQYQVEAGPMEDYFTFTKLIGVRQQNLSPYRDARVARFKSVQKMMDLIHIAKQTQPQVPQQLTELDPFDPEWDDLMPFPVLDHKRYIGLGIGVGIALAFYGYNYNVITNNIRFRTFRNLFPLFVGSMIFTGFYRYRLQTLKINLFDEYCYLRSQELIKQNEYLFKTQEFERLVWWKADLKETLNKIYRQANDNKPSDFKDSELLLQDFINRYVDPSSPSPMKQFAKGY